jgi:hypothetical protein
VLDLLLGKKNTKRNNTMEHNWYYVENNDYVGPVNQKEIAGLLTQGTLDLDSYVWRKGLKNWEKIKEINELSALEESGISSTVTPPVTPQIGKVVSESKKFEWGKISQYDRVFTIRTGLDRGLDTAEYGPFSMANLKRLYKESRINEKTYIYTKGIDNWKMFGDLPIYSLLTGVKVTELTDEDRRADVRRPFVARMFIKKGEAVYEGVCRDISVGGMQVLVAETNLKVGNIISLNVHPDNTDYCFIASGKVIRILEGTQGFSLRFMNLSQKATKAINSYIENSD